jgi:hypothetical protein
MKSRARSYLGEEGAESSRHGSVSESSRECDVDFLEASPGGMQLERRGDLAYGWQGATKMCARTGLCR